MLLGFEGGHAGSRTLLKEGDVRFVALSWGGAEPPTTYDDAYARLVWTAHHWQHWLARGRFPDHPWRSYLQRSALTLKGLTYAPTGAVTAAGSTSLPETTGRQPQLRLPLRLDPRRDVRAVGDVLPRPRLGGRRLLLVHLRHGARRPGPPDHVRHRRRARARGVRARPPARLRRLPPGAHRQRGLLAAPARRLGSPARLGLPALARRPTTSTTGSGRSSTARSGRR